jgi:urease accessory protein
MSASDGVLLHLLRLASPALPVGGFSYSEGLEAAIEGARVRDEAGVLAWLADHLHLVLARADLPLLAEAVAAWQAFDVESVASLNDWFSDTRETSELRLQAEQMGRSLAQWLGLQCAGDARLDTLADLRPAPLWPVAFALALACGGAPLREGLVAYAFAWAENMVQAALKAVPLGQSAGQRVLSALAAEIPGAVDAALALPPVRRQSFAPMLAVVSAQHETQYSRLFRS